MGLAASQTPTSHCRERRSAWLLNYTAPPTLPDRVRPGSLVETAWITADQPPKRVRAGCVSDTPLQTLTYARWPTLLDPWVEGDWRSAVERLPLATTCNPRSNKLSAQRSLRITGIEPGSVLRTSPGRTELTVQVRAIGSKEAVTWLLNGQTVGNSEAGQPSLKLKLTATGAQALTALDAQGRYERVEFRVQ